MKGYKLIPGNWRCRWKRYAVGKTAVTWRKPKLCERGMHFCRDMKDCLTYYDLTPDMHMCEVEAEGDIDGPKKGKDSKCCTNKLHVVREIPFEELMEHIMEYRLLENGVYLLQYIEKQTPEICLAAVQQDGLALRYVKDQIPEICLTAVQQDGYALRFVKNQTPEICLAAVQQTGFALQFVQEQTPEICTAAIRQNGLALECVKDQTPEICLAAVRRNGWALEYVREQTPEICLAAVQQDSDNIEYIRNENTRLLCRKALSMPDQKHHFLTEQQIFFWHINYITKK